MKARRAVLYFAEGLIVVAALLALLAVEKPGPIRLTLFMGVGSACIFIGVLTYTALAIRDFFSRRGVTRVRFGPGEVIFVEGEHGDNAYRIIDGQVEVARRDPERGEVILARRGAGDFFGEMSLLTGAPRTATVRTLTPVNALRIGRGDFDSLFAFPDFRETLEELTKGRQ